METLKNPVCDLCDNKLKNMELFSVHMKNAHGESDSTRIARLEKSVKIAIQKESMGKVSQNICSYDCTECGILFNTQEQQKCHNDKYHTSEVIVIKPDDEFLTQNTNDLEEVLKFINQKSLNPLCHEEFERDFNDILNEKVDEEENVISDSYKCGDCKFKASSKKVLSTHSKFVHDLSFYACKFCKTKTKTIGAMKLHRVNIHKNEIDNMTMNSEDAESGDDDKDYPDEEDAINIDYQHNVDDESGAESYKGNKPSFVETVKAVK